MSRKMRFQMLLEPEQMAALKRIQQRTASPLAAQIRRAVDQWIVEHGDQADRTRASTRKWSPQMNTTITFAPTLFGQQVDLQDGSTFASLQSHAASAVPWTLPLKPGMYVIARVGAPDTPLVVRPGMPVFLHINAEPD